MFRKFALTLLWVTGLALGSSTFATAGVEPSPFQPQINVLHSIELNVAAINKRLEKLEGSDVSGGFPPGTENYLQAMSNQMEVLSARLEETLLVLQSPSLAEPYEGQMEVLFALGGIKADSGDANLIFDKITARMGVGPSPFKSFVDQMIDDIDVHLRPVEQPTLSPAIP